MNVNHILIILVVQGFLSEPSIPVKHSATCQDYFFIDKYVVTEFPSVKKYVLSKFPSFATCQIFFFFNRQIRCDGIPNGKKVRFIEISILCHLPGLLFIDKYVVTEFPSVKKYVLSKFPSFATCQDYF